MRGTLWAGVAVQALGALATLCIGIVIAGWQGPAAQGQYGLVRFTADLVLALALFGLPQSLVHAINQQRASPAVLLGWSVRYAAALLALALLVGALSSLANRSLLPSWLQSRWALTALLAGSVGWVLHGLQRALVLSLGDDLQFAWLSAAPALTLLMAVAVLVLSGRSEFEWALLASGLACACIGFWQTRSLSARGASERAEAPRLRALLSGGMHAFAQTLALTLQPWLSLQLMRLHGVDSAQLGQFVFAGYVYQAFALPASFIAPLLFARVSRATGKGRHFAVGPRLWRVLCLTTLVAVAVAASLPSVVPVLFKGDYAAAAWACAWMALCGPTLVFNRLGVSVLMGRGHFAAANKHAVCRALVLPLAMELCWAAGVSDAVSAAALSWFLVEGICAIAMLVLWKWPASTLHGVDA
jgi:O-antigen/teichoic acid export membrane protein